MSDRWVWDETLFEGAAPHYATGRLPYPRELVTAFREEVSLTTSSRLLDVGCGTGQIALLLAPLFDEVLGLDADPGMVQEADRDAARLGTRNARFVHARAEELPLGLGAFAVATFAQSFHWMDRERVAAIVLDMLEPGGAWVHVKGINEPGAGAAGEQPYPDPPCAEIGALVERYLGPIRRAGQGTLPGGTPSGEAEVMIAAGYVRPRRRIVPDPRIFERSVDDLLASVFSRSAAAPHLFGDRLAAFERDLRDLLQRMSSQGRFSERARDQALTIWERPH